MEKQNPNINEGGYDLSRLSGTLKYEDIICNSCRKIVKNGEICSKCFKVFCGSCLASLIEKHVACPKGGDHGKMPLLPLYENLLNELMIRCVNANYGCPEVKEYKMLPEHETGCEFVPTKCSYSGCDVVLPKKEIAEHLGICGFCPLSCEDCGKNIVKKDVEAHDKVCLEKMINCENSGCEETFKRGMIEIHKKKCLFEQLECKWCKNKKIRKEKDNHEIECDYRIIKCNGCGKDYENRVYKEHVNNCGEFEFPCEKCTMIIKKKEVLTHNCLANLVKKLISLESKVNEQAKVIREQSVYIASLEKTVEKIACKSALENKAKCSVCNLDVCLICENNKCSFCNSIICKEKCSAKCAICNVIVCKEKCLAKCSKCGAIQCKKHFNKKCSFCQAECCALCTEKCQACGEIKCKGLHTNNCETCMKIGCIKCIKKCSYCKKNECESCNKVDNFEFDSNKVKSGKSFTLLENNMRVEFEQHGVICGNKEFKSGIHIYQVICCKSGSTCKNHAGFGIADSNFYNANYTTKGESMYDHMVGIFTEDKRSLSGKFTKINFGSIYEVKLDFNKLTIEIKGPGTELQGNLASDISYVPCFTSCAGTEFSIAKVIH